MSNRNPFTAKKNITIRWRKKKNLCLICGQDPHKGDCIEIYDKADMRTLGKPVKVLNEDKREYMTYGSTGKNPGASKLNIDANRGNIYIK